MKSIHKRWTGFILFLSALLLFVGCAPAETAKPKGPTRSIQHSMGKTDVPTEPKRVVVLTNEGIEALLAVGVKPVGAVRAYQKDGTWYKHLEKDLTGVKDVGTEDQPNIEAITNLKPDLIIGNKVRQEKVYNELSSIAPTVFADKLGGDWQKNLPLYADAVNKKAEGEKVLKEFDQRVEDIKKKAGDKLKQKISLVRFVPGETRIYYKQSFPGSIIEQLGFARPEPQTKDSAIEKITKERLSEVDGDILFYFLYEAEPGASDLEKEWMSDPVWQKLNVVKNKKVHKVDDIIWTTAGGIKAAHLMLDDIEKYVINK
ncbi:ABC transporter substrate-binding protein [Thermoflavimicrobium daqui]|uniref:Fe/B12 periplasmic-binding domain-containing protein n=1 Tax=Thermoflavimicrobium daqui TaxID=2137476 RepID=A0A364K0S6_9BACL|nr:iron-siderophore ABC transporter substrate-binding protein [Thermoflavimicrobium daqui]RAL21106.1 hypothetical protein DL897_17225 [Thermoflavimicrobium daqui]